MFNMERKWCFLFVVELKWKGMGCFLCTSEQLSLRSEAEQAIL